MGVVIVIGTAKGAFLARSASRSSWSIEGPLFKGWKVTSSARDPRGRTFLATASDVYGPALHVSEDLASWRQIEDGPSWPQDSERKLNQVWTLALDAERFYAGVDEAGMFVSEDQGESWRPVEGLNEHPTRGAWYPGAGGLCAHAILVDPCDPDRLWCGISAVGVFRSDDGGQSWNPKNEGIPAVIEDKQHKQIGRCVHALVADPDDPQTLYRREHWGMFRTRDGGDSWEPIESGLSSRFGFPLVMDRKTRTLFAVPMESDEYRLPVDGKLTVFRSRNAGESWEPLSRGLPQENAYMGILRGAMDADQLDPCGLYIGSTAGTVHVSADAGESWSQLSCTLPRILHVAAYVE